MGSNLGCNKWFKILLLQFTFNTFSIAQTSLISFIISGSKPRCLAQPNNEGRSPPCPLISRLTINHIRTILWSYVILRFNHFTYEQAVMSASYAMIVDNDTTACTIFYAASSNRISILLVKQQFYEHKSRSIAKLSYPSVCP